MLLVVAHQDVRRLEVAVDDEPTVRVVDGTAHLEEEPDPVLERGIARRQVGG